MVTAIHPKIRIAKGGIDKRAVMGTRGIVMLMGTEELAGDTHALNGDRAGLLQAADDGNQRIEEGPLLDRRKRRHRLGNRPCG